MQKYLYERSITRFIYRKKNYLLIISLTCKYVSSFVPACWIWIRERHVRWWEIINGISEKSKRQKTANCQIYSFLPQNQNYKLYIFLFIWIWRRWVVTLFHVSEFKAWAMSHELSVETVHWSGSRHWSFNCGRMIVWCGIPGANHAHMWLQL